PAEVVNQPEVDDVEPEFGIHHVLEGFLDFVEALWTQCADHGLSLRRRRFADEETVVTLVLETVGELGPTLLGDASVDEDVNEVRLDVAEDPGVVRDEKHAEVRVLLGAVDTLRNDL